MNSSRLPESSTTDATVTEPSRTSTSERCRDLAIARWNTPLSRISGREGWASQKQSGTTSTAPASNAPCQTGSRRTFQSSTTSNKPDTITARPIAMTPPFNPTHGTSNSPASNAPTAEPTEFVLNAMPADGEVPRPGASKPIPSGRNAASTAAAGATSSSEARNDASANEPPVKPPAGLASNQCINPYSQPGTSNDRMASAPPTAATTPHATKAREPWRDSSRQQGSDRQRQQVHRQHRAEGPGEVRQEERQDPRIEHLESQGSAPHQTHRETQHRKLHTGESRGLARVGVHGLERRRLLAGQHERRRRHQP